MQRDAKTAGPIWTIGHSTRNLDVFLGLLGQYDIQAIADVRRFPGSRRNPQYSSAPLEQSLAEHGIAYRWFPALGGRRKPRPDSVNIAWRNASFRGYADYMGEDEFAQALSTLIDFCSCQRTALMCAEALWWRCHRALIADVLSARGFGVVHILDGDHAVLHPYTAPARVVDGRVSYRQSPARAKRQPQTSMHAEKSHSYPLFRETPKFAKKD